MSNLRRGHLPGSTLKPQVKLPKDPTACWTWLGPINKDGYGQKQWHGRTYLAHRWLWMQLFGPIPDHLPLQNTCGNTACPSPHHWVLSSQSQINGSNVVSVLTPGDVVDIKRVPKAVRSTRLQRAALAKDFAAQFGCSKQLVYDIWAGRAWKRAAPSQSGTLPHPEDAAHEPDPDL